MPDERAIWTSSYLVQVPGSFGAIAGASDSRADGPRSRHDRGILGRDVPRPGRVTVDRAIGNDANGTVKSSAADSLVVTSKAKGKDAEWTFAVGPKTQIRKGGKDITAADLEGTYNFYFVATGIDSGPNTIASYVITGTMTLRSDGTGQSEGSASGAQLP